ncbi:MAG TPA: hypothetical protein VMS17_21900 [Gemmataceae bacterium]|nr:hypothetical protein [Gemmataceae bacterium]
MSINVAQFLKHTAPKLIAFQGRTRPIRNNPPCVRLEGPEPLEARTPASSLTLSANPLPNMVGGHCAMMPLLGGLAPSDGDSNSSDYGVLIGDSSAPVEANLYSTGDSFQAVVPSRASTEQGTHNFSNTTAHLAGDQGATQEATSKGNPPRSGAADQAFTNPFGSFLDGNPFASPGDFAGTINWGDSGSKSTGAVDSAGKGGSASSSASGWHSDATPGTYNYTQSIAADSGGAATLLRPTGGGSGSLTGSGSNFQAVEGGLSNSYATSSLSGLNANLRGVEGSALNSVVVARLSAADPNATSGDFAAVVQWGDGSTSSGAVSADPNGGFDVTGSHTYLVYGTYTITTTVTDIAAGSSTTGTTNAVIADAALSATAVNFSATAGSLADVTLATFTDADPNATVSDYQATIAWGDGSTSSGTVSADPAGGFDVTGTHTYAQTGNYQATVTITDAPAEDGGQPQTVVAAATVSDPTFAAGTVDVTPAAEGSDSQLTATFVDGPEQSSSFQATIDWGDGDTQPATIVSGDGDFQINADHTYLIAGTYTPTVTITDPVGDGVTESGTMAIADAPLSATGATAYAGVNSSADLTVAAFTDADPNADASYYSATIAWGDGTSSAGVVAESSGVFTVSGTHTYTATGTFAPTATIQDVTTTATATGSVIVSTVAATAQPASAANGVSSTLTLATFTDSGPGPDTATIDWGDGTAPSAGQIGGASGTCTVSGSHSYAAVGNYVATVTITTAQDETSVVAVPVAVTDGTLTATGADISAAQGVDTGAVVVATFTAADPNATPADFGAAIAWGDGSDPSNLAFITQSGSTFSVSGDYTYLTQGTFTVTTTITDGGGATATATGTATVGPGPINATAATINAIEGIAADNVTVATFAGDASAATIDWGDGSTPTAGVVSDGAVYGSHTYAEAGTYAVNVTLSDPNGYTTVAASTANVADAALTAGTVSVSGVTEGQLFSGTVASFTDADPAASASDFTASIAWGDGQVTAGTVSGGNGSFTVSGAKTYYAAGSFPIAVTVTDADGASVVISGTASVADAALTGTAASINATVGDALNGVTVATFTDAFKYGSALYCTATINWGDGTTTAGVVGGSDGTYSVSGSHTYTAQGSYPVTVTFGDAGGSASVVSSAQVSSTPNYGVGSFSYYDPNNPYYAPPASDFTATINWGDNTAPTTGIVTSTGSNSGYGGSYTVTGTHAYAEEGTYNVTVTVAQQGGPTTQFVSTATVAAATALAAAAAQAPAPVQAGQVMEEVFAGAGQEKVANDRTGKTFTPQWTIAGGAGAAAGGVGAADQSPLAYVSGTAMTLTDAAFWFPGVPLPAVQAVGTVTGPGIPKGMTFTVPLTVKALGVYELSGNPVAASVPFNAVTQGTMDISWKVDFQNGLVLDAGTTANRFYVTYKTEYVAQGGTAKPLYETVLATGSQYNGGNADSDASVILNAWKVFKTLNIPRIDGGGVLGYYDTYTTPNDETSTLLRSGDGMCIAWSKFLIDVLEAQGIHQANWNYAISATNAGLPQGSDPWWILVKAWKFDPAGPNFNVPGGVQGVQAFGALAGGKAYIDTYKNKSPTSQRPWVGPNGYDWISAQVTQDVTAKGNLPGQGQPTPASLFQGHNVVAINYTVTENGKLVAKDELFDPSYGATYNNDQNQALNDIQANVIVGYAAGPVVLPLDAQNQFAPNGTKSSFFLFIQASSRLAPQLIRVPLPQDQQNY